ncbi:hypothetical protein HWV62_10757 [Athelia sp. TMB]|nr:hypothetical protein HWV62_10757 [Athelia sp. TMB]
MSELLQKYSALSSSSSRTEVTNVLDSAVTDSTSRRKIVKALIDDVYECTVNKSSKGRLVANDAGKALLAAKMLGKIPAGSEIIGQPENLSLLLTIHNNVKGDSEAGIEALRCIANALLLIDTARAAFVSDTVGGGKFAVAYLDDKCGNSGTVVDVIAAKLDLLITSFVAEVKMAREAMTDALKFIFNLLVHYPKLVDCEPQEQYKDSDEDDQKVLGDFWSTKLDGRLLPPLLRVFKTLPPLSPGPLTSPLAECIHSLITIPVSPSLRHIWLGGKPPSRSGTSTPSGIKANQGPVDRALSAFAAGRRSLSLSRPGSRAGSPTSPVPSPDIVVRVHELLDGAMRHYLPGTMDPDNIQIRNMCKAEGETSLDDVMSPLVLLVSRLALADDTTRVRFREILLPADLDRSRPLESREDLLGRCLRMLSSVHHARLKDAVGEMLFAICDSNATTLSAQVGYGNVAGFLFNKGVMSAPAQPSNSTLVTPSGEAINPITGTLQTEPIPNDMTDEEREREAEKLMVLFDRMERTGTIASGQNPIRKAIAQRYS